MSHAICFLTAWLILEISTAWISFYHHYCKINCVKNAESWWRWWWGALNLKSWHGHHPGVLVFSMFTLSQSNHPFILFLDPSLIFYPHTHLQWDTHEIFIFNNTSHGYITGPDGAVVMSSADGLVGTGFVCNNWSVPMTGVCYNSLFWMCMLKYLTTITTTMVILVIRYKSKRNAPINHLQEH